ncbi:MAG: tryptophan-rich sensory protein [Symploca sp. SIO3C6]|uniref:Tryptophan-rich sensory protein n=1 Tax=Symploca sp. SIO1C4 TaxID=2607765 RepID=A0A6B3N6Y9_9CYAN|nr:tryptophan-rich sensory protein [Symploca sp. SIO3C6]NER27367.1 tryptophan-rich sensory protein [Symploca sp. SIO1C4]NET06060.1 tryptophan-rich sensory protein [Symploca sp. SIO2B6]
MAQSSKYIDRDLLRQLLNLSAIIAAFAINVLANVAPINGLTIGEISNTIFREVQITPANYAFAIWGLIYLGLISFGFYQAQPALRTKPILRQIGYPLILSSLAQICWVFLFQYGLFPLSLLAMLVILLPLIGIYLHLGIGLTRVSVQQKWFVHMPISIYLGWISVATIVNVALVLYYLKWDGWGISPQGWTVIMLIGAAVMAAIVIIQRADIAYPLVIVWALVAIAVRHSTTLMIAATAGALVIAIIILLLSSWLRRRKSG